VLDAVLCNRANKEIASKLNITVRTVKFHISSLLSKFGVESRAELARRASGFMRPQLVESEVAANDQLAKDRDVLDSRTGLQKAAPFSISNKSRGMRFPGRILTA
jgi:hypothetical protein